MRRLVVALATSSALNHENAALVADFYILNALGGTPQNSLSAPLPYWQYPTSRVKFMWGTGKPWLRAISWPCTQSIETWKMEIVASELHSHSIWWVDADYDEHQ
jgi:hypothetical protein